MEEGALMVGKLITGKCVVVTVLYVLWQMKKRYYQGVVRTKV